MRYGLTLLCCVASLASASQIYSNAKKPIVLNSQTHEFVVSLPSNPTTGFRWYLVSYDAKLIKPISHQFIPPTNKKLMGAPGNTQWTFKVLKAAHQVPQASTITWTYVRPWETIAGETTTFTVRFMQ